MSGLSLGIEVNDFDLERVGFSLFVLRRDEEPEASYFRMTLEEMAWFVEALKASDEVQLVALEPVVGETPSVQPAPRLPHVEEAGYPPEAAETEARQPAAEESDSGAADVIKLPWLSGWVGRRESAQPAEPPPPAESSGEQAVIDDDPDDPRRLRIMRREPRKQPGLF